MKKVAVFLLCAVLSATAKAQVPIVDHGFHSEIYGTLLNLSNAYSNAVYTDTVTNASTIYLTAASGVQGNAVKFPGLGSVDVKVQVVQVSGKAYGYVNLEASIDNSHYSTEKLADSFRIDSTGTIMTYTFKGVKNSPYLRLNVGQKGTGKNVYTGQIIYQKNQYITSTK